MYANVFTKSLGEVETTWLIPLQTLLKDTADSRWLVAAAPPAVSRLPRELLLLHLCVQRGNATQA